MTQHCEPLVSIVTPVYNGALYLGECVESVLAQTYSNWEYTIVNNCSTDDTRNIAEQYARNDQRIRVCNNDKFLDIIASHNRAFQLISPRSKYCKVVSADDWIFPECLARMVSVAEMNPSVGLVGSYQLSGGGAKWGNWKVKWTSVPYPGTVIPGREICRVRLLGGPPVFGPPTSLLYRADLVRETEHFYPNPTTEADASAIYRCLEKSDFGFVHQVLSYERIHPQATGKNCRSLNTYLSSRLSHLINYGPHFLTKEELNSSIQRALADYYRYLAESALQSKDKEFWRYHKLRLKELGYPLSYIRLARVLSTKMLDLLLNPKKTVGNLARRILTSDNVH